MTFITLPIDDFKKGTQVIRNKGIVREITFYHVVSVNRMLILIDDNFAELSGFKDRAKHLAFKGWLKYSHLELYIDPIAGILYTFKDVEAVCLN